MARCDDCGSIECRNGSSCSFFMNGNCRFCHCNDDDDSDYLVCGYCDARFHHSMNPFYECVECEQQGCSDCINAECEGCCGAIHYDGEGGEACAPFTGDQYYYALCSWCEKNRNSSDDNDEARDEEPKSSYSCPDCGSELEDYVSLDEHRTEGEGFCDHIKTTTRGDREICFCCGEDLGYWQSNEEFYDTIGAPYDDPNP